LKFVQLIAALAVDTAAVHCTDSSTALWLAQSQKSRRTGIVFSKVLKLAGDIFSNFSDSSVALLTTIVSIIDDTSSYASLRFDTVV